MQQGQYGNTLFVVAGVDLSNASEVTVKLTRPHKSITWLLSNMDIGIGTSDLVDGDIIYPSNTYVERIFQQGDIDQSGKYKVTIQAVISGKLYTGPTVCFTVNPSVGDCC